MFYFDQLRKMNLALLLDQLRLAKEMNAGVSCD